MRNLPKFAVMSRPFVTIVLSLALAACSKGPLLRDPDSVVLLYRDSQTASAVKGLMDPVHPNLYHGAEKNIGGGFIEEVGDSARLEVYLPDRPNGKAIVVCPGGGYSSLNALRTGKAAGSWLSSKGFAAVILCYRMPCGDMNLPVRDLTNAMLYCRSMASEWGVSKIGVAGGSAGGHLAALACSRPETPDARPDFAVLLYPLTTLMMPQTDEGILLRMFGHLPTDEERLSLSVETLASGDMPPVFIAANRHDFILPQDHFLRYYDSLVTAGAEVEMHLYSEGYHGWGFLNGEMCRELNDSCLPEDETPYEDQMGSSRVVFDEDLISFLKRL